MEVWNHLLEGRLVQIFDRVFLSVTRWGNLGTPLAWTVK